MAEVANPHLRDFVLPPMFDDAPTVTRDGPRVPPVVSRKDPLPMKCGDGPFGQLFALKHSKAAYLADFVLLYASIAGLAGFLFVTVTRESLGEFAALDRKSVV